jgi:hypothetical protein
MLAVETLNRTTPLGAQPVSSWMPPSALRVMLLFWP